MTQEEPSPTASTMRRVLLAWLVQLLYTASPIDIVPDVVPVLGWLDDAGLFVVVLAFTMWTLILAWRNRDALRDTVQTLEQRGQVLAAKERRIDAEYTPVSAEELESF